MIKVLKFGGTSVATPQLINNIADYLKTRVDQGEKLIVVVSAMGKETDLLQELAKQVSESPSGREFDQLLATGEIRTTSLLSLSLNEKGVKSISFTGAQVGIYTSGDFQNSIIDEVDIDFIYDRLKIYDVLIVAGFQGVNENGEITTLGRGGSDTTAVAIASRLLVDCEIYTDVNGIYSTDPRLCPKAKKIDYISYEEMNELSSLGASVMHNRSITIANKYKINIYVGKTLSDIRGTYIMDKKRITNEMIEQNVVTGVAVERNVLSTSIRFNTEKHMSYYLMDLLAQNEVNIDMVSQVQNSNETGLAFTCSSEYQNRLNVVLETLSNNEEITNLETNKYAKISLVGLGMRNASGVVGRLFKALSNSNIDYHQITTSEISISLLVDMDNLQKAVNIIMIEFGMIENDEQ